jgi:hypothetical protein
MLLMAKRCNVLNQSMGNSNPSPPCQPTKPNNRCQPHSFSFGRTNIQFVAIVEAANGTKRRACEEALHARPQLQGISKFDYEPFLKFSKTTYLVDYSYEREYLLSEQAQREIHALDANTTVQGPIERVERKDLATICHAMTRVTNDLKPGESATFEVHHISDKLVFRARCEYADTKYYEI